MFHVKIDTKNAAFEDDERMEIIRILRELIKHLTYNYSTEGKLFDYNGNSVGKWRLTNR